MRSPSELAPLPDHIQPLDRASVKALRAQQGERGFAYRLRCEGGELLAVAEDSLQAAELARRAGLGALERIDCLGPAL